MMLVILVLTLTVGMGIGFYLGLESLYDSWEDFKNDIFDQEMPK